ncbi:unnamed protein product [Tetraodon nigroviridis]|uniref:(spotted green pufferfish) hypothetical protein n=1 Tax=Tetraodon nigroviridis TaxID=99883 RepID=Q4RS19_TETNG|nr:unnamed protein product [Tetraodon nigroviridis]
MNEEYPRYPFGVGKLLFPGCGSGDSVDSQMPASPGSSPDRRLLLRRSWQDRKRAPSHTGVTFPAIQGGRDPRPPPRAPFLA